MIATILIISLILNVLLALALGFAVYLKIVSDNEAFHCHQQWEKWEHKFHDVQHKLIQDHNLFCSFGLSDRNQIRIEEHKNTKSSN